MIRDARFALAGLIVLSGTIAAQNAPKPSFAAEVKANYARRKDQLTRAAAKMPEANYGFKAAPEIRTFADQVNHVAQVQVQAQTCGSVLGQKPAIDATKTSKANVMATLKQSFDICDEAYNGTTDANAGDAVGAGTRLGTLWFNNSHDNEMYGTIAVYLRLKGIVPPSSEPPAK
jgi:hypothetical protein